MYIPVFRLVLITNEDILPKLRKTIQNLSKHKILFIYCSCFFHKMHILSKIKQRIPVIPMSKCKRNKIQQTLKDAYPSYLQWNGININIGLTRLYNSINECVCRALVVPSNSWTNPTALLPVHL
jgi:hypothetical protein